MKKFYTLFLLVILVPATSLHSQKEWNNWFFGNKASMTFNTINGEPRKMDLSPMEQLEGSASISDSNGMTLLITDGRSLWNSSLQRANTDAQLLDGNLSSTQSAFIINHPDNPSLYYIFTVGAWLKVDPPNTDFKYSTFDMSLNYGITGLVDLNKSLLSPVTEKLCATYHRNGRDIWIMVHAWKSSKFYAYLLTAQGVQPPVVSDIGTSLLTDSTCIGAMKFSPNSRKLAYVAYSLNYSELFKFDNETGIVSNPVKVDLDGNSENYGLEFSPNSNVMYITSKSPWSPSYKLYQFDVQKHDSIVIANSKKIISQDQHHFAALQLGPNGKIYMAVVDDSLGVIAYPNMLGTDCALDITGVPLAPGGSKYGLPNTITRQVDSARLAACEGSSIRLNPGYELADTAIYPFHYEWNGPNGFHSTLPTPQINDLTTGNEGKYELTGYLTIDGENVGIYFYNDLTVERKLNFKVVGPSNLCTGSFIFLKSDTNNLAFKYRWSDGSRFSFKIATKGGKYKLYITHGSNCLDSAEITITESAKPVSQINCPIYICDGEQITLQSAKIDSNYSYLWSTGDTNPFIVISEPGLYWLKINTPAGCSDSSAVTIQSTEPVKLNMPPDIGICGGSAIMLKPEIINPIAGADYTYNWSTGATTESALISSSGDYWVEVGIDGLCKTLAKFHATKADRPKITLNVSDTVNICGSDSVWVEVTNYNPEYKYYWSDGYQQASRFIKGGGSFTLYSNNLDICYDSAKVILINSGGPHFNVLPGTSIVSCQGGEVTLSLDTTSENWTYLWSDNETTPSIKVDKSGSYFLTVTDISGCSKSVSISVTFVSKLPISITGSKMFCEGDSTRLIAYINDSEQNKYNYEWSTGETSKTIYAKESGTYSVEVTSEQGCVGSSSIEVTKLTFPTISFNSDKYTLCSGDSVIVGPVNPDAGFTYLWTDGDFPVNRTFKNAGIYKLVASNKNYCSDTANVEITVWDKARASIMLFGDSSICIGESVVLSAVGSVNYSELLWSTGDTTTNIEVSEPGDYYLYAFNENGCSDTAKITIKPSMSASVNIKASSVLICEGQTAQLSVEGEFASVVWSDGNTGSTTTVPKPGIYSVLVVYPGGCTASDTVVINGASTTLTLSPEKLEFDGECVSSTLSKDIQIENTSDYPIRISGSSFAIGKRFKLKSAVDGLEIAKGGKLTLTVEYDYLKQANDYDTLNILYDLPCAGISTIPISSSIDNSISIVIPGIDVDAGADTCFSVLGSTECVNSLEIGETSLEIKLRRDLFSPVSVSPGKIIGDRIEGDMRIITIQLPPFTVTPSIKEIARLCGLMTLGDSTSSTIGVESLDAESGFTAYNSQAGMLNLTGCMIGLRSVDFIKLTQMDINPNPVLNSINIGISSQESGQFNLDLISETGEKLYTEKFSNEGNNILNITKSLDATQLSEGLYFVKLSSPWGVLTRKVLIMKQ